MALKKPIIARIATLIKVDQAALEAAIADKDEKDIAIDEKLQTLTEDEQTTRDRNKYNEGKKAGSDMALKDVKTKAKVEIDSLDPEKIAEAVAKKAVEEAKIAPDEQVKAANKLTDQWKEKARVAEEQASALKTEKEQLSLDNRYRSLFPKDRSDLLNDDEYLMSTRNRFEIKQHEGQEVVVDRTTGDIVRNKTDLKPVAPAEVFKTHFNDRKWMAAAPGDQKKGGGGGNSNPAGPGGKYKKISEFRKDMEEQGISLGGSKGNAMLRAAVKDNPDMDMSS